MWLQRSSLNGNLKLGGIHSRGYEVDNCTKANSTGQHHKYGDDDRCGLQMCVCISSYSKHHLPTHEWCLQQQQRYFGSFSSNMTTVQSCKCLYFFIQRQIQVFCYVVSGIAQAKVAHLWYPVIPDVAKNVFAYLSNFIFVIFFWMFAWEHDYLSIALTLCDIGCLKYKSASINVCGNAVHRRAYAANAANGHVCGRPMVCIGATA